MRHQIVQQDLQSVVQTVGKCMERLRDKRILITGGTGFIGTWLLETIAWVNDKWNYSCQVYVPTRNPEAFAHKAPHLAARLDIHLLRGNIVSFLYPDVPCDFIIHAAAPGTSAGISLNPLETADTIVNGTRRVLDFAVQKCVQSLMFVSSGAVYGTQPPEIEQTPEDYSGAPDLINPKSAYGEAKRYAEMLCALFQQKSGVPTRIARPFTFVGPYQDLNAGFAVTDFIRDGLRGLPLQINGDGTTVRSYCYTADLTAALWKVLLAGSVGRVYNIGSNESVSILSLAREVASALKTPVEIVVRDRPVPGRKGARYVPNIGRMQTELNIAPWTSRKEAVCRTVAWMQNQQEQTGSSTNQS